MYTIGRLVIGVWRHIPMPVKNVMRGSGLVSAIKNVVRTPDYEPDVCRVIENVVQPGWTVADVGANVGLITRVLARLVGSGGCVVAFEAHPDNARRLRDLVNSRGLRSTVEVENVAVNDGSSSLVKLYPGRNRGGAEWNIVGHDVEGNRANAEMEIEATSLDARFPPGSPLQFVKIDVEGAEGLVISGMQGILDHHRPIVLIEFHDEEGWAAREKLYEAGYGIWDLHGNEVPRGGSVRRIYQVVAAPAGKETMLFR